MPIFRILADSPDIDFRVLFAQIPDEKSQGDGFNVSFKWDLPLLEGYEFEVLENVAKHPSVTSFWGCDTPSLKGVLCDSKTDALIVNGWVTKTCMQGLWAAKRLGIPCIVRGEANNLRHRPYWKRLLQRQLVRRYDGYLCIGKANRQFYESHGVSEQKLFSAPYCVENKRFKLQADRCDRNEIRSQYGIANNLTTFMFCGKLIPKKYPVELISAFCDALDAGAQAHLLIVGDGPLRQECARTAERNRESITFAGFKNQTQLAEHYVASDCLVLPSDSGETWGLVVNEAMACRRPAIVSDQVGCAQDLIDVGHTGARFRLGHWQELTQCILRFASSPKELREMGEHAANRIDEYSPEKAAEGILKAVFKLQGLAID